MITEDPEAEYSADLSVILLEGVKIGVSGFEPPTSRTPSECATRLRHTPMPEGPEDPS